MFTSQATALTSLKYRLDIPDSNTDFDTQLNDFLDYSLNRLYPAIAVDLTPSDFTLAKNTTEVAFSSIDASLVEVHEVYVKGVNDDDYEFTLFDDWFTHDDTLTFQKSWGTSKEVRVHGKKRPAYDTVPSEIGLVVIYWAMSEFYEMLVGNERKFSKYQNLSGVRNMDAMADKADRAEGRANSILADRFDAEGL